MTTQIENPYRIEDMSADELRHIARKLTTYADIYTGDKEARSMALRCSDIAELLDAVNRKSPDSAAPLALCEMEPWQTHLHEQVYAVAVRVTGDQPQAHAIADAALRAAITSGQSSPDNGEAARLRAALREITDLCRREPADPFLADKMDRVAIAALSSG